MKNTFLRIALYAATALTFGFGLTACEDEPDKFSVPPDTAESVPAEHIGGLIE